MKIAEILSIVGWALVLLAVAMLATAFTGLAYQEYEACKVFLFSAFITAFTSGLLILFSRGHVPHGSKRENVASVIGIWLFLPLFAALPIFMSGSVNTPLDAYFESISGLTTTGATVINSLEDKTHALLLWRSITQLLGGIATVVFVVVHFAHLGIGGMQLYPSSMLHGEQDSLLSRFKDTGLAVLSIYSLFALLCFILLVITGIPPFDAITHAFSTISTGGFSTRDASVGGFSNIYAEIVIIVFMILGAFNASVFWLVIRRQELKLAGQDPEIGKFLRIVIISSLILALALILLANITPFTALYEGIFAVVSSITTTGYYSGQGVDWPIFVPMFLLVLMFAGGCSGSTSGGLKTMRLLVLFRLARREMFRLAQPNGVEGIKYGKVLVDNDSIKAIWAFFVVVALTFGILIVCFALTGLDLKTSIFTSAGALTNTIPANSYFSDGLVTYENISSGAKLLFCLGMVIGRLEFFTALILFNPFFWRR